jgi:hypothetical protein
MRVSFDMLVSILAFQYQCHVIECLVIKKQEKDPTFDV